MVEVLNEVHERVGTLLANQQEIKTQVTKTNGRVTFLEKVFWSAFGGASLFIYIFHDKLIKLLVE